MTTKALPITAAAVAAVWLGVGFNAQLAYSQNGAVKINPFLHTATVTSDYELPKQSNTWGNVGFMLGAALVQQQCEPIAAVISGFGWRATVETRTGQPMYSCWTWR